MDLFLYGTLQSAALMQAVAGGKIETGIVARLDGYAVRPAKGNVVPYIVAEGGKTAQGVVVSGLTETQMNRLNAYEGAFGYTLEAVTVTTSTGPRTVHCYLPPSGDETGAGAWSFANWQADHETPAVMAAQELFSHDPVPDHATLRAMWPMMESRAWAKHRAQPRPATRSFAPDQQDMQVHKKRPPQGNFFRLQGVDISHTLFRGGQSEQLIREVFMGVDAVIVLPYDPVRDKVLFVEQFRNGPFLRNDPNPWMLEAVAGMIDARETPETAAYREAVEEAQLTITHLEPAGSHYPSPGSTTDYFYTYVGLCDLPMDEPYFGGLADEGEDLRLHPMSFDAAMALLDSGEIATGPVYYLLYWLARHRDRLRQVA